MSGAISNQTFEINPTNKTPKVIQLPVYWLDPCDSSMSYTRQLLFNSSSTLPSFITYSDSNGTILIDISNPKDTDTYSFSVLANESVSGNKNTQVSFNVTLTCTISVFYNTVKNVKNVNYVIGAAMDSKAITMAVPVYETQPDYCLL